MRSSCHALARASRALGAAAAYPVVNGNSEAVVKAADEALYLSKNEGRNRTTLLDVNWTRPAAEAVG